MSEWKMDILAWLLMYFSYPPTPGTPVKNALLPTNSSILQYLHLKPTIAALYLLPSNNIQLTRGLCS